MEWNWSRIIAGVLAFLLALMLMPRSKQTDRSLAKRQQSGYTECISAVERVR